MKLFYIWVIASILIISGAYAETVCCEKTVKGDSCQYVDISECAADAKNAPTNCVFTSFCKPGCCFSLDNGRCYMNMPMATCILQEQTSFADDAQCNIPQCDLGCCIIGNEASLITQTRCKKETAKYPGLGMVFKEDIKDEAECVALARGSDKGCCVVDSDTCTYTARENCELKTGIDLGAAGFFKDRYCSDPALICDCVGNKQGYEKKGCVPKSDDVYYFDSCGNQEGIAEDCDYVEKQTTCGQDEDGKFKCLDLSCKADDDLYYLEFNTNASKTLQDFVAKGTEIKNGESWCEYDTKYVGFGRDVPGSRYYRGICINNKIKTEACKDYREEFCISDTIDIEGTDYREAACRANRWDDCTAQVPWDWDNEDAIALAQESCLNTDMRDCTWTGEVEFPCVPFVPPGSKFWEAEPECSGGNSQCVVTFKVGGLAKLLSSGENVPLINDILSESTESTTNSFVKEIGKGWECIDGCECLTHAYLVKQMNKCRMQGDCGADYNIQLGAQTNKAILNGLVLDFNIPSHLEDTVKSEDGPPGKITQIDLADYNGYGASVDDEKQLDKMQEVMSSGVLGGMLVRSFIRGVYSVPQESITKLGEASTWHDRWGPLQSIFTGYVGGATFGQLNIGEDWGVSGEEGGIGKKIWSFLMPKVDKGALCGSGNLDIAKYQEELNNLFKTPGFTLSNPSFIQKEASIQTAYTNSLTNQGGLCSDWAGRFLTGIDVFFNVYNTLNLVDILMAETETVDIDTVCSAWQAPVGSKDCEECNPENSDERSGKLCSEYTCKSFGQSCVLLNEGTGNETCVSQNPYDVSSPIISVWEDVLGDYKVHVTKTAYGYKYNTGYSIPAFSVFPMAIKTNEPAQCKMSLEDLPYDDMELYFGSELYSYNHLSFTSFPSQLNVTTDGTIEIAPGQKYIIYVKCQDSLANKNERSYSISFNIASGPDTTPPIIEGSSIPTDSYVTYGINSTEITLYVSEPATCKWSLNDEDYEKMNSTLQCGTSHVNQAGLYECAGRIGPIVDQVLNQFYFRCADQPSAAEKDRNYNLQSYKLSLRGSYPFVLDYVEPSGIVYGRNFTLEVQTSKGASLDGKAYCYYDPSGSGNTNVNNMVQFFETNGSIHRQMLTPARRADPYNYTVVCVDYGGNMASGSTSIIVTQDIENPYIKRIYKDESYTPAHLKIILNEPADCEYKIGENFVFGDGKATSMNTNSITHDALYEEDATYYINCKDMNGNLMLLNIFHA